MYKIGDNIISSLGFTTDENFHAVIDGMTGIKHYDEGVFDIPEPFMASLIDKERLKEEFFKISSVDNYTNLEKASILSVFLANKQAQIDLSGEKTIFILSTTKGNVDLLDVRHEKVNNSVFLWRTAELITSFFGNQNTPIVISNACISGAAAQIEAMRVLQLCNYDYAVVVGVDFLSKFIISGFQSFKALSQELCRPFDKKRCGLNLGEAAATMIFSSEDKGDKKLEETKRVKLVEGAVRNDACHISAPSRTGEGSFRALKNILHNNSNLYTQYSILNSQIAFINAHGTATQYNDAMEMNAIVRAGLENIPVNSLKSYFGHTLGAAGVVETIISLRALSEGIILKTLGFENKDPIIINDKLFTLNLLTENSKTDKKYFIKMMSGFGGVNVALLFATI
ncbi:MAG: beta-ketoacyl synthase [Bacteroidales bacterium]|jgi:3-oxoacyl-[acyl-carrier-protein] synthase-1|nr:beta-ketoacyl synthase [Bacteroidales bacterium]